MVTGRTHVVEVPVVDSDLLALSELMQEQSQLYGHKVGMIAVSGPDGSHLTWTEPAHLSVVEQASQFRDMARSRLRLQTRTFHAAVGEGQNILQPVPWEGTSTPGSPQSPLGLTAFSGRETVVYDDSSGDLFLFEAWDRPTFKRLSPSSSFGSPLSSVKRSGQEEILVAESASSSADVLRVTPTGSSLGSFRPKAQDGSDITKKGIAVAGDRFVVQSDSNIIYVYDHVPKGGTPNASSDSNFLYFGAGVTFDEQSGDLLSLIVDDNGDDVIRRHDGVSGSTTASLKPNTGADAILANGNTLYVLDGSRVEKWGKLGDGGGLPSFEEDNRQIDREMPLRVRDIDTGRPVRGYFGPTWMADHDVEVDVRGLPDTVSSTDPIELQMPFPFGGAEVRLGPYRYAYGQATYREGENGLVKIDLETGEATEWFDDVYAEEPVFVPEPETECEDMGVVLATVLDPDAERSFLLVLDGETFEERARAWLPHHLPFGFHGRFVPD